MAKVTQVGPGRKTSGTIDGLTYVTRGTQTYVRTAPKMPASAYKTPDALKRQAVFKMVQMHMKYHLRTIKQTITPKGNGTAMNRYYSLNGKALTAALSSLAELYVAGQDVSLADVEQAISDYATENPQSIIIGSKSGYATVYLTGAWPEKIVLNALSGDSTVIVIVNEYGVTTTINADGSITSGSGDNDRSAEGRSQGENQDNQDNSSSGSGSGGSSDDGPTGGDDGPNG